MSDLKEAAYQEYLAKCHSLARDHHFEILKVRKGFEEQLHALHNKYRLEDEQLCTQSLQHITDFYNGPGGEEAQATLTAKLKPIRAAREKLGFARDREDKLINMKQNDAEAAVNEKYEAGTAAAYKAYLAAHKQATLSKGSA